MSRRQRFLCGVPEIHCRGSRCVMGGKDRTSLNQSHSSREEAFKCMTNYLTRVLGYTQLGSREFSPPDGGPIRVLTKKTRFGYRLRAGKEGRYMREKLSHIIIG